MAAKQKSYSVAILTVSDSRSSGERDDVSGAQVAALVLDPNIFPSSKTMVHRGTCPDDKQAIKDILEQWSDVLMMDLILTVGGTGFSPRDVTPEATEEICSRKAPSLACAMTSLCYQESPFALLSRATCGIRGNTIILNLPGSIKGSKEASLPINRSTPRCDSKLHLSPDECFVKISKILPHAIDQVRGHLEAVEESHKCHQGAMEMKHIKGHLNEPHQKSKVIPNVAERPRISPFTMLSVDEAMNIILSETCILGTEIKTYKQGMVGHVAARDVKALVPSPPFRASVKDGYAVLVSDGTKPRKVTGVLVAGDEPESAILKPGGCVRVNTGAPVPLAADAVVQVEDTAISQTNEEGEELEITISKMPTPLLDIREIGSDIAEGEIVIHKGKIISAYDCGILASAGVESISVYKFPQVALLSTGNELVNSKNELRAGLIIDSSKPVLRMLLKEMNVGFSDIGIAKDDPDDIKYRLNLAFADSDVVIITGGVSMGEKDYVKDVLITDFSAKLHFGRIHMKPGKPTAFATVMSNGKKKIVFCLPGNPVSTIVTFHLFVVPCIRKIMGQEIVRQTKIGAVLGQDINLDPRPEFCRCNIDWNMEGKPTVNSTGSQMSSRLLSLSNADGLIILPPKTDGLSKLQKGSEVLVMLLNCFRTQC